MATDNPVRRRLAAIGWSLLPFACLAGVWYLVWATSIVNTAMLPSPAAVAGVFWQSLTHGDLAINVAMSVKRVVFGLALGMLLAVPVAATEATLKAITKTA